MTTTKTTTVSTTTTTTTLKEKAATSGSARYNNGLDGPLKSVARVEDLGRQAAIDSSSQAAIRRQNLSSSTINNRQQYGQKDGFQRSQTMTTSKKREEENVNDNDDDNEIGGNNRVTTISTIAAQSGQSRIVLAILKDGTQLQLKVQEMRPSIFEVGGDFNECSKYLEEHQKLMKNLRKQKETPIENWLGKYHKISTTSEPNMSIERKLVYMCMLENLQACWKALLKQLDKRFSLLREVCGFYESVELFAQSLDRADKHVQVFRKEFFAGPQSLRFNQACNELKLLNDLALEKYNQARRRQQEVVDSIRAIGTGNLGDSRVNQLISGAQDLINYISSYLDPLDRRRLQLESLINTTTKTTMTTTTNFQNYANSGNKRTLVDENSLINNYSTTDILNSNTRTISNNNNNNNNNNIKGFLREINNFNDLNLVDNWLNIKIEQLNSSLLSSLGLSVSDSRAILDKHEQIALECRAIEEASLTFDGKSIHAIKSLDPKENKIQDVSLFEQQKLLAQRTRNVLTILDARLVLLRRTIDFYLRSKEATLDVNKMMRRLQVDNSLQSVQFVSNELELKDVSSVVASGATIINELQQLQLAQQHGQRSRIVNLNLVTSGIRTIIDQLSQDLTHLKTVLNQRRIVLMNEDATKMANNFSNKCHQLQFWLNSHVKSFLSTNNRIDGQDLAGLRSACDKHEQLRVAVQNKTLEVEALLRSLPTLSENFDAKSNVLEKIQQETDELRHNWIQATNCLDRRLDLIRKYLAILNTVSILNKEFESLESFIGGRPTTPDRTDADIRSNIEQNHVQLSNQVRNFNLDSQKLSTELEDANQPSTGQVNGQQQANSPTASDINKQQMVDHANELLRILTDRKQAFEEDTSENRNRLIKRDEKPAHQRPQQIDPPRFTRTLGDQVAEPFSTVELECETDQADCQVEWFMNNFKKIPQNIRHSSSSEGNQHKLTIHNFSPVCCGTYLIRAWNGSGQAVSQCKLRLAGIKESQDEPQMNPNASLWRQHDETTITQQQQQKTTTTNDRNHLNINNNNNYIVESPVSSTTLTTRSMSKSPFEVSPQPSGGFTRNLTADSSRSCSRSCSRSSLVCVVVGNPPPTIEWTHNNQTVATTTSAKDDASDQASANGNFCKLTIATNSPRKQGQCVTQGPQIQSGKLTQA